MFEGFEYNIQFFADVIVGFSWVIAYALCFIGTVKEKVPGFPPLGSIVILAWEFSAVIEYISNNDIELNYVFVVRASFFVLQFAFFSVALFKLYKDKPKIILLHYLLLLVGMFIMHFVFKLPMWQLRTSFANTITGWLCLLYYIHKIDYPPSKYYLGFAVFGFIADAAGHFLYLSMDFLTSVLCIILQFIQLIHVILVYDIVKKDDPLFLPSIPSFSEYIKKNFSKNNISTRKKYKKKIKQKKTHRKK